jgi:hypothetical protein
MSTILTIILSVLGVVFGGFFIIALGWTILKFLFQGAFALVGCLGRFIWFLILIGIMFYFFA